MRLRALRESDLWPTADDLMRVHLAFPCALRRCSGTWL